MVTNGSEQGRTTSNDAEQRGLFDGAEQRQKNARDAWVSAIEDLPFSDRAKRLLICFVDCGYVVRESSQGKLAKRFGMSSSTVNLALKDIEPADLVDKVDGEFRLDRERLGSIHDVFEQRRREEKPPPEAALDALEQAEHSRAFAPVRDHSRCARTVEPNIQNPVSPYRTVTETGVPSTDQKDALKQVPEWQALQTEHFRPSLDRDTLGKAFFAAVRLELLDDDLSAKRHFWATALDISADDKFRSPAVILRRRVEMGTTMRVSNESWARAKTDFPEPVSEYAEQVVLSDG